MGLNPVLYIANGSLLAINIRNALVHFALPENKIKPDVGDKEKSLLDILRYIKNYQGDLTRRDSTKSKKDYRFSDEREWRYVPPLNEECILFASKKYFDANKEETIESAQKLRLNFEPNDIKYIIIENDEEIPEFIEHVRSTKGKKYTHADIERLTTRILTSEQIKTDM
ncbi:MAG: hypothetical protein H7Z73_04360 [Candidatus Saccharibacteria bacterium]|nr:hypothetical protein [Moraxellaceae bacterium]